ncbi:hypothetical protein COHA_001366 [Chlorella ohadii]|uniref:Fungal lipase-type domain-containing protein n=1 Tax=Chlorella ohadii TaxID=2649997 RepID=A0AAD5H8T4_9CHLO|nr:hypothetical protein COHA_001366 [Chlorella ohadii]
MAERRRGKSGGSPQTPLLAEEEPVVYGTLLEEATTNFARRNPLLAAFIPDCLEDAVDVMLPDAFEAKMERGAQRVARRCARLKTDFALGVGEVAATLLRVCKYALSALDIHDIIFGALQGIYSLAQHHAETRAEDAIRGTPVRQPTMLRWLLYCCNLAMGAYCPTKETFAAAVSCKVEDIVELKAESDRTRPAYVIGVDHKARQVVLAFRGTTDLDDMLTDACATCTPYMDGYAHLGMLKAASAMLLARWFVKHKLAMLRDLCDEHAGYGLLLVGHSLGAGTAVLVAHLIRKGDPEAVELMKGVKLHAVGIATPAVLTANLAEGCNGFISSVVLQQQMVGVRLEASTPLPALLALKQELDATGYKDKLKSTAKDWMVPDIIEHTETYKRLMRQSHSLVAVVTAALARWYLLLIQWVVTFLRWTGLLRLADDDTSPAASSTGADGSAAPEPAHRTARQMVRDTVRGGLRATARAAQMVMHHRALPEETLAAIERACEEATKGDACIHALYSPGRLYFLKRTDAPKEEAEAIRKAVLERRASRKAERAAGKGNAAEQAGEGGAPPAAKAGKAAADASSGSGSSSDDEDELLFPGAKFELIRGAPEERFKRIVLQDTCLKVQGRVADHLCSCYCWAVQQLAAGEGVQQEEKEEPGEQSKRKEE